MKKLFLFFVLGIFLISFTSAVLVNQTSLNDTFESGNLDFWTDNGATDWMLSTVRAVSPTHSVEANSTSNGDLLSDNLNMSDASAIYISFSYWDNAIDDNDDVILYYWDGAANDVALELGTQTEGQWNNFSTKITDAQYFDSTFRIYIEGTSIDNNENLWIDDLLIIKEHNFNTAPNISNISLSSYFIKGGNQLIIYANTTSNGVNDSQLDSLTIYCSNITSSPSSINNTCSGSDASYPYDLTCAYNVNPETENETVYCTVFDGTAYSSNTLNATYSIDSTVPILSIVSVAEDNSVSYFDTANDGVTSVNISGEANMVCRWAATDLAYSGMSNSCTNTSSFAICNFTDVSLQGVSTRYISCQDSVTNENNATNNLNVLFTLDYTAPTTSDNSNTNFQLQGYNVTLNELDNVDGDPTTIYCTSSSTCIPSISIDTGQQVMFTTRGINYLRYNSSDDAGNNNSANKTININQLPLFISASDNATTIKGGDYVNVSTQSYDLDSGQGITIFVCSSNSANSSGCTAIEYCNETGIANLTCAFPSETDSTSHSWYAFIFDDLGEAATTNPLTGTYTTDSSGPEITIISPSNITYSQNSVTAQIVSSENLNWSSHSLNESSNVTLNRIFGIFWSLVISNLSDGHYNLTFYANDSVGNYNQSEYVYFTVNASINDTTAPTITIISPLNNTYYIDSEILLNITSEENLTLANYSVNGTSPEILDNASMTSWNDTYNFVEGTNNITFYATDNSSNVGTRNVTIYVDLTNASANLTCSSSVNDSENLTCLINASDTTGLDYSILSYNFSGIYFVNSSQIDLNGTSDDFTYTFTKSNYTPGNYSVQLYVYDLSGRVNNTELESVQVLDDTNPLVSGIFYSPNNSDVLDPNVNVTITASVTEDYSISSVDVYYKNGTEAWQNSTMTNTSLTSYNSTIEFGAGNWTFYINATDATGNTNISSNYTFEVAEDISQIITTNITSVVSISSASPDNRGSTNLLGYLILNTTSDTNLTYNVSIFANETVKSRFNLNNTGNQTENYSAENGTVLYIPVYVNSTGLERFFPFNISVISGAGVQLFERNLNIQPAGPYLVVSIEEYDPDVNLGQTDVELIATVTNLGTADASGVVLTWSLPSLFTLTQGNLTRNLGSLPVGVSSTNTIKVSVSSTATDSSVNITATATATAIDSDLDTKTVTIRNPLPQIITIPGTSSGGGSGGSKSETIVYSKTIEIVRGETDSFDIEVKNKYSNTTMKDLTISIEGFLSQYISIIPKTISELSGGEKNNFRVTLKIPSYKENYEEYTLKATITGTVVSGTETRDYKETQNIRLIIQEISREKANASLLEAQNSLEQMQTFGFNEEEAKILLSQAEEKLAQSRNKDSYDLSQKVISLKDQAVNTDNLIRRIAEALQDPQKSFLLLGNVIGVSVTEAPLDNLLSGQILFGSEETKQLLQLAITAFERGDYVLAEERAKAAQSTLILERKGNAIIFIYLYWKWIILATAIILVSLILIYKLYKRHSITEKIGDADKEENNLRKLLVSSQSSYLSGKVSGGEYHREMGQFQSKLGKLKQMRLRLRNERVKLLGAEELSKDLSSERKQVETEIKKIQSSFYTDKKIPEIEYKTEFNILNERLAEIEEEKITSEIIKKKKVIPEFKFVNINEEKVTVKPQVKEEKLPSTIPGFKRVKVEADKVPHPIKSPVKYLKHKRQQKMFKSEVEIKEKIVRMLKNHGK